MSMVAVVAIYAAVISTLALMWQIHIWRRSRPELRITAEVQSLDKPDGPPVSRAECICTIVNSGGHPISLVDIWVDQVSLIELLGVVSTRRNVEGVTLPLFLGPGECYEWRFSYVKSNGLRCNAKDALGRIYQCNVSRQHTG